MFILFIFFVSPLATMLSPRRWLGLVIGLVTLLGVTLWLDEHTVSSSDLGMFGRGDGITIFWTGVALTPGFVRLIFRRTEPREPAPLFLATWLAPAIVTISVLFMHWLRNRLAGAAPSWLIHLPFFAMFVIGLGLLWKLGSQPGHRARIGKIAGLIFASLGGLAVGDTVIAIQTWAEVAQEAKGRPFCLQTYAGTDHPRPATRLLDLSPLISRFRGRSYRHGAPFLVVETGDDVVTPMHIADRWGKRHFSESPVSLEVIAQNEPLKLPACSPTIGGGIQVL